MNYKKYIVLLLVLIAITSCHSIKVNKSTMRTTAATPVSLGVIGEQSNRILNSDFRETAIPLYKEPIRIGVSSSAFNATAYKAYISNSKNNEQNITYIDSLETKPLFLQLKVLDRVALLSELKKEENQTTFQHIKNQKDVGIISAVSVVLPQPLVNEVLTAEAVFLVNKNYKQYQLSLIKNGTSYKTINFSEATIFRYELSHFCWTVNDKRKIILSDIVDTKGGCPKNAYKSAKKAKEKMDYFKL